MAISQESLTNFKTKMGSIELDSLNGSYQTERGNGNFFNLFGFNMTGSQSLVGITPQLVSAFEKALESYKTEINGYLDVMQAKEATVGFKGEAVNRSIKNFVGRVIEVSKEYLTALENVEKEMIAAVQQSYSSQDTSMSSSVKADSSVVESQNYSNTSQSEGGEV